MLQFEEVEEKIKQKVHNTNWSICKIKIDNDVMFRFRVIGCTIEEGTGWTLEEAINDYLIRLPDILVKK